MAPASTLPAETVNLARVGDEPLAAAVAGGRQRAFEALYERYHQPLYRYCRSMLANDVDAQDALQSTFAAALAALQRRQRRAPLRPWLFRIAHNESISLIRRRREQPVDIRDEHIGSAPGADEVADGRDRLAVLMGDLGDLPERQRSALVLRELSGLSHADIAGVLGTTEGAAKQAIFDARTALAELAEGRALSCEEIRRKLSDRDRRTLRGRKLRGHLRSCSGCATFAAAIDERRSELRALTPVLTPAASAALLGRLVGGAGGHAAASGGGGSALAGVAGKLGSTAAVSKMAIGAAVIVTAAGVDGLVTRTTHRHAGPHPPAALHRARGGAASSAHAAGAPAGARSAASVRHTTVSSGSTAAHSRADAVRTHAQSGAVTRAAHSKSAASRAQATDTHEAASAVHPAHPAHPVQPAKPTHPAKPVHPLHPLHPVQPATSNGAAHASHPAHPTQGIGNSGVSNGHGPQK